jgi:CO/xanthine dehydrogenase Mo-binding subunit
VKVVHEVLPSPRGGFGSDVVGVVAPDAETASKALGNRLSRYRVPRFAVMPVIESVLLDCKDLPSAGAGESPIMGIAPAVGNAIFDATGQRVRSLPMAPQGLGRSATGTG